MALADHEQSLGTAARSPERRRMLMTALTLTTVPAVLSLITACESPSRPNNVNVVATSGQNDPKDGPTQSAPAAKADKPVETGSAVLGFLTLPFRRSDLPSDNPYEITEGWIYSEEERSIHGSINHGAIDFAAKKGTPLLTPVKRALAVSSYEKTWARNEDGSIRVYEKDGRRGEVSIGFGFFVELRLEDDQIIQLAHMSEVNPKIPFHDPTYDQATNSWKPTVFNMPTGELRAKRLGVEVQLGEELGLLGHSALMWGRQIDYMKGSRKVTLSPEEDVPWDEDHTHMVLAKRINMVKSGEIDPFDIRGQYHLYPSPSRPTLKMGPNHVWILGPDGLPAYSA